MAICIHKMGRVYYSCMVWENIHSKFMHNHEQPCAWHKQYGCYYLKILLKRAACCNCCSWILESWWNWECHLSAWVAKTLGFVVTCFLTKHGQNSVTSDKRYMWHEMFVVFGIVTGNVLCYWKSLSVWERAGFWLGVYPEKRIFLMLIF